MDVKQSQQTMELKSIVFESAKMAMELPRNLLRLATLIILSVVPLVNLTVVGYGYRCIEERQDKLPELKDFGKMFIEGFKVAMVVAFYVFLPISLIFGIMIKIGIIIKSITQLMLLVYSFIFAFSIPMFIGLILMILNDTYYKAFDFRKIFRVIKGIGYLEYFIWLLIVFLSGWGILALNWIKPLGWILGAVVLPFYVIFVFRSAYLMYRYGAGIK
jgi:hypothetical protein